MEDTTQAPISELHGAGDQSTLTLTDKAVQMIKITREQEGIEAGYGLRVAVKGGGCSGMPNGAQNSIFACSFNLAISSSVLTPPGGSSRRSGGGTNSGCPTRFSRARRPPIDIPRSSWMGWSILSSSKMPAWCAQGERVRLCRPCINGGVAIS